MISSHAKLNTLMKKKLGTENRHHLAAIKLILNYVQTRHIESLTMNYFFCVIDSAYLLIASLVKSDRKYALSEAKPLLIFSINMIILA
ncbi:hypothetical protein Sta7437_3125 [Stanieria cyanosphaera PCC 7437]|uniref:Uncharacterized protein n=1 Tax=Stanieria cyanosphaera (strain ATCC 29371 / PCC 7437) TaxID=111780 RepID=K9XX19_STAC7|nr:hypothetical protein Sta7437_3125 [Stanieria cyanosphaera PCC 7437]